MKSVPPRGSWWVYSFFMKPFPKSDSTIANQEPTRYRVVVLTPRHPVSLNETVPLPNRIPPLTAPFAAAYKHKWKTW